MAGILLQWWTNAVDYPFLISGKPMFSLPAFIPVAFETTILLAAIAALVGMLALNGLPLSQLDRLPEAPGVYLMKDAKARVIYVGKALSLRKRVRSYFTAGGTDHPKQAAFVPRIRDMDFIVTDSDVEALLLEMTLINEKIDHLLRRSCSRAFYEVIRFWIIQHLAIRILSFGETVAHEQNFVAGREINLFFLIFINIQAAFLD